MLSNIKIVPAKIQIHNSNLFPSSKTSKIVQANIISIYVLFNFHNIFYNR